MKQKLLSLERWNDWLLPLSFTASGVANLVFFYLGLALEENAGRKYGFILVSCMAAVLIGLSFLKLLSDRTISTKHLLLSGLALLFFTVYYLQCFARLGWNGTMIANASKFIVFCVPALLAGVCAATRSTEAALFEKLEQMTFLVLPAALFYTNSSIFQCNPFNYGRDLGIINYMSFAYTVMPFLLAHLLCFADGEPFYLPVAARFAKRPQLLRGALIALYWYTILACGTRGTYVCVIGFCFLMVLSRCLHRQPVKCAAQTTLLITGLLLFAMFVYTLPGLQAVSRMTMFVDGLKQGELITSNSEDDGVSERVDELVSAEGDTQIANRPADEPPATEPSGDTTSVEVPPADTPSTELPPAENPPAAETPVENQEPTDSVEVPPADAPSTELPPAEKPPLTETPVENQEPTDITEENLQIRSRGTLFTLAWKEFLKSPLIGMGAMGYTVKYGMYPHNVILELLCETGVVGFTVLMGLILLAIIKLLIVGSRRREVRYVLLFLMAYAIEANISGSLWACPALLCALGYGLAMPLPKRSSPKSALSAEPATDSLN